MALTYTTYEIAMASMLAVPDYSTNATWAIVLPRMIEYAEQRIYRELDLVNTNTLGEASASSGNREVTIPSSIIIVHSANVVTPAATAGNSGTRHPLLRASLEFINSAWPTAATTGTPQYYALKNDTTLIVAPTPDAAYKVECIGPVRPAALASGNTTTFISTYLPDLLIAASMVFGAGYQRDFGSQADDPKLAMSWEQQYQTLKMSAMIEEARRKAQSTGWQAMEPTPLAQPDRGAA